MNQAIQVAPVVRPNTPLAVRNRIENKWLSVRHRHTTSLRDVNAAFWASKMFAENQFAVLGRGARDAGRGFCCQFFRPSPLVPRPIN